MAKKLLGKVVAGAALGGASLLVCAPGIAVADDHHRGDEGKVQAKPHAVEAGHEVKLLQFCPTPQEHAYVWSKVTGKVPLRPAEDQRDGKDNRGKGGHDREDKGYDYKGDWGSKGHDYKGYESKGHDYKGYESKGHESEGGWGSEAREGSESEGGWGSEAREGSESEGGWGSEGHDYKRHDYKGHDYKRHESEGGWGSEGHDYKGYESKGHDYKSNQAAGDHGDRGGDRWEHKRDYVYYGEAMVDRNAKPGTYKLEGSCGEGELVVLPRGGVDGGDGGVSAGTNLGLAAGGAGLVGAAALGGLVLLRRRTNGSLV